MVDTQRVVKNDVFAECLNDTNLFDNNVGNNNDWFTTNLVDNNISSEWMNGCVSQENQSLPSFHEDWTSILENNSTSDLFCTQKQNRGRKKKVKKTDNVSVGESNFYPLPRLQSGEKRIGIYTPSERKARIDRYLMKRKARVWKKKIKYNCRQTLAVQRPRLKGRFIKMPDSVITP